MEDLLPYYERELVYLRRLGREFYERYPRLGGALQLSDDTCPDPHVEQLIQSVALLSARVAKRLDDSYPELTEALLETMFPHYLRPFPSCSIVRATYPSIKSAGEAPALTIPRGTEMDSSAIDGVRCCFKTAYPIVLSPITLKAARFDAVTRAPSSVTLPASASSSLSVLFDGVTPSAQRTVRVYIDGEPSFCAALRDALFMRAVGAYAEVEPGRWLALQAVPLAPVGFADDEALIPFEARSHVAYRVLSEYFVFQEKFNFFDIDLGTLRGMLPPGCRRFTLHVALAGLRPESHSARMLSSLSEANLLLSCSPVVNLFQRPGQPVSVTHLTADYEVAADAAHPQAFEVYSIDSVKMVCRRGGKQAITEFRPFYSLRHGEDATKKGHYWMLRNDDRLAAISPGHEKRITLVDGDFDPMEVERTSLSIALTCTNKDLPNALKYGQSGGDLTPLRDADSYSVCLLRRPTKTYRFPRGSQQWRLISHLTVNHRALSRGGLPGFREMLTLYNLPDSPISRRQIEGITALEQAATVTWMRHKHGASLVHGTEMRMTVDEEAFVGSGLLLFVQVIDQFLGLYVQVNSFIELDCSIRAIQQGTHPMQAKKRLPDVSVIQGLIDEPERFQFFQAVRTLVRWLRPVGMPYDQALSHVLRFQNSLSLNFAPSQIEALWAEPTACATDIDLQRAMRDHDGATICVTPAFMGLLGGNGAMPIHHTERIDQARRMNKDNGDGARAFIDLFSQRMLSMFFQAWGKYRLEHRLDMGDDDTQLPMLTALAGIPPDPRSDGACDVADETAGFYAALLRTRPVAASSVSRVLTQQFGVPVELEPFVETWDVIPENKRSKLGGNVAKLGFGAALGGRVRRRDLRVRLNIGPLDKVEAERFLPRGAAAVALAKTMAKFDLPNLQVEVRVLFKPSCVKPLVLNSTSRTARRLNWDAFLPGKHDKVSRAYAGYLMHPADMDADGDGGFRAIGDQPA